jgi:hypothetical protein
MWYIEGPKGRAKAELNIRLRAGEWQMTKFEVTVPDGKGGEKVKLEEAGDNEAPPFAPPKPAGKPPESKAPPDINLPVPSADAPP